MRARLFLSYRRTEHSRVLAVKEALDAAGVDVFLDTEAIDPLEDFPQRIAQAIGASHVLLAWWSRDYAESDHCLAEFKLAWQHARRHGPDVGGRVWVLDPDADAEHVTAGELDARNFLRPPEPGAEAAWAQALLPRLAGLLPEGPLNDERNAPAAPGQLHRVPIGAEHFVGRNAELMRIHSLTHPPKIGDAARDVAVRTHGLGGIGKTELALQYARQFCAAYPGGVFWLNLAGFEPERYPAASRVEAGQAAWADALRQCVEQTPAVHGLLFDAEGKPLPPVAMRARLAAHFEGQGDRAFLWVLDNVPTLIPEDLRDALLAFWRAPGATGRTLLTTREDTAMTGFQPLPLGVLGREDALRLLALHHRPADAAERQAAEALVEELGRHPQALTLLARWIEMAASDRPYADAMARIAEAGALQHIESIAKLLTPQLGAKARGIVAAFETSITTLGTGVRELLTLAAVCAPNEAIPRGLLAAAFGPVARSDECTLALNHLRRCGLLTDRSGGETMEIHPLIAETALLLLHIDDAARDGLEERIVQSLLTRLSLAADPVQRDHLVNDVRQAQYLALRRENEVAVFLGLRVGQYFSVNGNFAQAAAIERHALEKSLRVLGEAHPGTLSSMNNLAETLRAQGDLAGALELQKSVLAIRRRVQGEEHPDTLTAMGNLALTRYSQGHLADALGIQRPVLVTLRRVLGEEHPATLASINNLANTLRAQGDRSGARELQESLLATQRRVLGEDHPHTLTSMNNLASTLRAQGDLVGARELQKSVLATSRRVLGEEHPNTLTSMSNLAGTIQAQGDLVGARELQESDLALCKRILSDEHPDTLTSMSNLALILQAQGDLAGGFELQKSVLATRRRVLGEEHPDTLTAMSNLAEALQAQGDRVGALDLQKSTLVTRRRVMGDEHPDTLTSMCNIANTLQTQDDLAGALELQKSVLATRRRVLGEEHPDTLTAMNNLAETIRAQGELAGALELQRAALAIQRRVLGEEHPDTLTSLSNLASTLYAQGDLVGALELEKSALATRRRVLGEEHPATLAAMNNLAGTLHAQGDLVGARKLQETALAIQRRALGEEHPDTLTAINNMAITLWHMNEHLAALHQMRSVASRRAEILGPSHPHAIGSRQAAEQMQAAIDQAKPGQPMWRHLV